MMLGKNKTVLSLDLLEKRSFLLDNRAKIVVLECISHCLRINRRGEDVVDEMGGLNSIIKLPSSDLADDRLLVMRRELGRMATFAVLLVQIHLLLDPADSRPS